MEKSQNMKYAKLKNYRDNRYIIEDVSSSQAVPLAEYLSSDYTDFSYFYWEEFFDKGIPIDTGGNTTWTREKDGIVTVSFEFGCKGEYTTTNEKFFKILEQWDEVVAKRPKKILIQEVDGEILIGPLEDDMN